MITRDVTIHTSFAPIIKIENRTFYGSDRPARIKEALEALEMVTGLAYTKMPVNDLSDAPGNEEYECFIVESPLGNRPHHMIAWAR